MTDNTNGRKWARGFLLAALVVSVVGNVTHTWLAESEISLLLRVPGAVVWPVFTWGAIEIVVRIVWEKRRTHALARTAVLFPAVPAAITSYEHLYNLLGMMGEKSLIQWIGPAAIDGLMIGCTLTLLFTRSLAAREEQEELPEVAPGVDMMDLVADRLVRGNGTGTPLGILNMDVPTEIVPVSPAAPAAPRTRKPRAAWNAREVCELAVDGVDRTKAAEKTGIGASTYDRYRRVAKALTAEPGMNIPQEWKVPAEHVRIMREMVAR